MKRRRARRAFLLMIALMCAALLRQAGAEEQCLTDAWKAYNSKAYVKAIEAADRCIDEFAKSADRLENALASMPEPPTGAAADVKVRNEIFARGLLNDIGTAWFVKGRSAEFLFRNGGPKSRAFRTMAVTAYESACRYKHARTWDPKGWFWSPCQAASDRLPVR